MGSDVIVVRVGDYIYMKVYIFEGFYCIYCIWKELVVFFVYFYVYFLEVFGYCKVVFFSDFFYGFSVYIFYFYCFFICEF